MATGFGGQQSLGESSSHIPSTSNFVYIYDIPLMEKKHLAALLEVDDKWYNLGVKQMGFTSVELESSRRCCARNNRSPAETLLDKWGNFNHTITELFIVLSREKLYNCMELIKHYVESRYHVLIKSTKGAGASGGAGNLATFSGTDANNNPELQQRARAAGPAPVVLDKAQGAEVSPVQNRPNEVVKVAKKDSSGGNSKDNSPFANELTDLSGSIPKISYQELADATDNWSERNILGKGGFGTVYRGVFKHTYMAIKKINYNKAKSSEAERIQLQQSFNELRYLNSCRHDNIVPLFGVSFDKEPCLVYQYMPGGSLDKCLFARRPASPLTWKERMNIALGTAKGLQYLHTFNEKPFIHGDIKPGNILLNEFKQARIGDFGLTRQIGQQNEATIVSKVYGTRPYIPKEFGERYELSTKVDTYSFGVVLYEMGTGLRAWDERRSDKHLKDYIARAVHESANVSELMDKSLPVDAVGLHCCYNLLQAGHSCTADDPRQRPDMVAVMWHLNKA